MKTHINNTLYFFLTLMGLFQLACSSKFKGLNPIDISEIKSIQFIIHELSMQKLDTSNLFSSKTELIDQIKNKNGELVILMRKKISVGSEKTTTYYFKNSKLISSCHIELNTAKFKNKTFADYKQYYFNEEKTILAESKTMKSNQSKEIILKKIGLKKTKKIEASQTLFNDEKALINKIKTSSHSLN